MNAGTARRRRLGDENDPAPRESIDVSVAKLSLTRRNNSFRMGRYLDQRDRDDINRLLHQGQTVRAIARALCRSPSTVSRELRKHRAAYPNQPPASPPTFDVAAARVETPELNRVVGQWFDTTQEDDEHLQSMAMRTIEDAAHTYRVALKTGTVTAEASFEALVARAIAAHPKVPERMWSKAIHRAIRSVLRVRAR